MHHAHKYTYSYMTAHNSAHNGARAYKASLNYEETSGYIDHA